MSEKVFLLGAGFSASLSAQMPVMSVLSGAIREELAHKGRPLPAELDSFGDDLERWISYLADSQPWLDEATILHHQGCYLDVARATADVLRIRQRAAVESAEPEWLPDLLAYWQRTDSTVITFNYDVLVEAAALEHSAGRSWTDFYRAPVTPAANRTGTVLSGGPPSGFALLKLHGSLNWFWSGLWSVPGDPVYDIGLKGGWSVDGLLSRYEGIDILVGDKVPMVVPPAATKSPFYNNALLRSQWVRAASALQEAEELVVIGYSLPQSDLTVRALLATNFRGDLVRPVDRGLGVVDHLRELFGDRVSVTSAGSGSAVAEFVAEHCG